jgi:hypothetical protein
MKVNPTLALTLILLSLMIAAGVVSGSWGFAIGREALKGVTQPDSRPRQGGNITQGNTPHRQQLMLLKEEDILKNVKARTSGRAAADLPSDPNQAQTISDRTKTAIEVVDSSSPDKTASNREAVDQPTANFPLSSENQGMRLEVRSVRQQNGYLLLDVSLQNSGSRSVQFLYSFMNVTDNQGRAFTANTEGLPRRVPPNRQPFSGTVSIPAALLTDAQTLSLNLTDYPNQQLQLQVSGIPVVR